MTFTTPCFVRVDDAAEREKLIEWAHSLENDVCVEVGEMVHSTMFASVLFASVLFDCVANIDLFKALAAMNDENDREQWFVDGSRMFKCYRDKLYRFAYLAGRIRKATAEEIVEYFTKREQQ